MGWLIALAAVVLIAWIPLGVSARYDDSGAVVKVIAGPLRFLLYPQKRKKEKPAKETPKQEKSPAKTGNANAEKKGGSVSDFVPLLRIVLDFLGEFRRKLRVNRLELNVILGGDDPCDLAVNYGRACAALASLEPQLSRFFVIKNKDLNVQCDFEEDSTRIYARIDLTITIGRFFSLGIQHGVHALQEYRKIMKLRKGGAAS